MLPIDYRRGQTVVSLRCRRRGLTTARPRSDHRRQLGRGYLIGVRRRLAATRVSKCSVMRLTPRHGRESMGIVHHNRCAPISLHRVESDRTDITKGDLTGEIYKLELDSTIVGRIRSNRQLTWHLQDTTFHRLHKRGRTDRGRHHGRLSLHQAPAAVRSTEPAR